MQSGDQQGKDGEAQKTPTAEVGKNQKAIKPEVAEERDSSLEDIGKYRGIAQHNSMEAIKAAQDRYQKAAKQTAGAHGTTTQSPPRTN